MATVEFVVVVFAALVMIFFVVELTALYFFIMSAQHAAYMGARVAAVSDPAAAGVPVTNIKTSTGVFGVSCSDVSNPCVGFTTISCVGGIAGCNAAPFSRILSRMEQFLGGLDASHVTITYAYTELGYAGGPAILEVTVRIEGVPYSTGIIGGFIGTNHGPFTTIPAVSVTLMSEDLSGSGG